MNDQTGQQVVSGWLMFFVVIFFINAVNLIAVPIGNSMVNWENLRSVNSQLVNVSLASSYLEMLGAAISLAAAIMILKLKRIGRYLAFAFAGLLFLLSIGGLLFIFPRMEALGSDIINMLPSGIAKLAGYFSAVEIDSAINYFVIAGYISVMIAAFLIFGYFKLSRKVKQTLVE